MNLHKIIFWAATGIMTCLFIYSIYLNLFQYDNVVAFYERLGFPEWLIYPSAILKILGLIAIYTRMSDMLKEWAYAGLFFGAILAFSAHQMAQDGQGIYAFIAAISVMVARIFEEKVFVNTKAVIT